MTILQKGKWYSFSGSGTKILVGAEVPCISNVYVVWFYNKSKKVSAIDAIHRYQNNQFKLLKRQPKLPKKYNERVNILMEGGVGLCGTK